MPELTNPTPWKDFVPHAEGNSIFSSAPAVVEAVRTLYAPESAFTANTTAVRAGYAYARAPNRRLTELERLRDLPEDWDGEGASPVIGTAIDAAEKLMLSLPEGIRLPDAGANPNGTVSLYWATPTGKGELEIGRSRYSWIFFPRGRRQDAVTQSGEVSRLNAVALVRFWRHLGGSSVLRLTAGLGRRYASMEPSRAERFTIDLSDDTCRTFLYGMSPRDRSGK